MAVFRRFYRVRPLAALLICLPGMLLCFWYAWSAFAAYDRYRRQAEGKAPGLEDFHLQLFDLLNRDLRRLTMPAAPETGGLDRFVFHVSGRELDRLESGVGKESQRPYAKAQLERGNLLQEVELRLRGQQHWHLLGPKKSLKVRLPRGQLLDGQRVFNLVHDPDPMLVGEEIILGIARQQGILVPRSAFARVVINGADLGVFRYEAQVDESVLRQQKRMPGSIFSGNLAPSVATAALWNDARQWNKVSWRDQKSLQDFSELERLLWYLGKSNVREFTEFARQEIDLRAFAVFEALDIIFGGEEHDFRHNHKLYFDPYKGRWEPVAWDFRAFRHAPAINLVENPILLRLKLVPEYLTLRSRELYRLLMNEGSVSAVRGRGMELIRRLAPDLASDRHWSAYKLLPPVDSFHRRMLRPMDFERLTLAFESEMTTFERRHAFLVGELEKNPLWHRSNLDENKLQLIVNGQAGVELIGFRALWPAGCRGKRWRVLANGRPVTDEHFGEFAAVNQQLRLYPAVKLVPQAEASPKRGEVRSQATAQSYSFTLEAACRPEKLSAEAMHLATEARVLSRPLGEIEQPEGSVHVLEPDDVPALAVGESSPHPWSLPEFPSETVRLGPGTVEVAENRVFGPHQTVQVAPGTLFRMGPGAALVFLGKVFFHGTASAPILVRPATDRPWGGLVLQGPKTAGSLLEHLDVEGGRLPTWGKVPYPGMVNIHDTRDVTVRNCRFAHDAGSLDILHVVYVENFLLEDTAVEDASSDAIDTEFVVGSLSRLRASRAGDELLDAMGSQLEVTDSVLVACSGNGVSAGEESHIKLRNSLVAGCRVGALAKNASTLDIAGSLLFRNRTGVEAYRRDVRFQGESRVLSDVLFVVDSEQSIKRDSRSRPALDLGRIQRRFPPAGTLDHLAADVLGLSRWEELPALVERWSKGGEQ